MRLILGAVFIAASIDKIAHLAESAQIVQNYQIIHVRLKNIVSIVLPELEALPGAFVLCGWWLPGATALGFSANTGPLSNLQAPPGGGECSPHGQRRKSSHLAGRGNFSRREQ